MDGIASIFAMLAIVIGSLSIIFSKWYIKFEQPKYYALMVLFILSMVGLVTAQSSILLILFWELTALCSFGLIGIKGTKASVAAANKALIVTQLGAVALITGFAIAWASGATTLSAALALGSPTVFLLFIIAALTKSAVFPFHSWLPSAMEAPTPVSALLHSSAMVMAGVYLIARMASRPVATGTMRLKSIFPSSCR